MEIDWSKAPASAEFYACGNFYWHGSNGLIVFITSAIAGSGVYEKSMYSKEELMQKGDYTERPKEWPAEQRIDIIATNGGDGEHYSQPPKTSAEYLSECLRVQTDRGKQYDASGTGERSFAAAAAAFNAATGKSLTGSDVCLLLSMVKLVRQYSSPDRLHQDSLLDGVSYMSLWAEELTKELCE
jgi:hypothetical protein